MKKLAFITLSSILAFNASAQSLSCGYKDFFHLSESSNPNLYVISGVGDSDVLLQFVGPRSFLLRDSYHCRSGYAHVVVGYDNINKCVLDIKDGPYMNHPKVQESSCYGLKYINTTYDGFGTHTYTMNFN